VDISHKNFEEHIQVVNETLKQIGAANISTILVFNKIDAYPEFQHDPFDLIHAEENEKKSLDFIKNTWMSKAADDVVFISVLKKINLDELRNKLLKKIKEIYSVRYPYVLPRK
jgi:GTP-binding protein HflX